MRSLKYIDRLNIQNIWKYIQLWPEYLYEGALSYLSVIVIVIMLSTMVVFLNSNHLMQKRLQFCQHPKIQSSLEKNCKIWFKISFWMQSSNSNKLRHLTSHLSTTRIPARATTTYYVYSSLLKVVRAIHLSWKSLTWKL